MLKDFFLCMGTIFCIIGIYASIKYIFSRLCKKSKHSPKITLGLNDGSDGAEVIVRRLMNDFPDSEILVLDAASKEENKEIIHKLCTEFGCVKYMGLFR